MKKYLILVSLVLAIIPSFAQQPVPASANKKSVLLYGGTVHTATGKVIEHGAVGIKDGKIILVTDVASTKTTETKYDSLIPSTLSNHDYDTLIDCRGKQIYPGFIDPDCTLGLVESGAVRATTDVCGYRSIRSPEFAVH